MTLNIQQKSPTFSLCTLGCKVNQYESQAIAEDLTRLGFVLCDFSEKCDVYIINTCTVTAESDKKSRQMIRRAVKLGGNDAIVVAAGCFTQAAGNSISQIDGLTAAFGNADKSRIASFVYELYIQKYKGFINKISDITQAEAYDEMSITRSERTRAVVKIVDGCQNKCSYCIIPSVRGKIRSRSPEKVISELEVLASAGYKEAVLTGIETAAYGKDIGCTLHQLLKLADGVYGIERIRLGSLEPTVIKDDFITTCAEMKHMVPHFHLSLQSGSDSVLRTMRRKYNTEMFYTALCKLREAIPDVTFTTDIIVGFPGETDKMFFETCEFVKKCGFLYVHIFPYSKRAGTPAAEMKDQIPNEVKKQRAAHLKEIMLETRKRVLQSFDGKISEILFEEKDSDGKFIGHTPHYIEAKLFEETDCDLCAHIRKCRLIYDDTTTEYMRCELV